MAEAVYGSGVFTEFDPTLTFQCHVHHREDSMDALLFASAATGWFALILGGIALLASDLRGERWRARTAFGMFLAAVFIAAFAIASAATSP